MPSYQCRDFHVQDETVSQPGKDGLYIETGLILSRTQHRKGLDTFTILIGCDEKLVWNSVFAALGAEKSDSFGHVTLVVITEVVVKPAPLIQSSHMDCKIDASK